MPRNKKIGVVGAGVMGQALIQGLTHKEGLAYPRSKIWAAVKSSASAAEVKKSTGVTCATDYSKHLKGTHILLLCVKPNQVPSVCEKLRKSGLPESTLIISIAAGVSIEQLEEYLGSAQPIIRGMTNTPCIVRQGMTAIAGGSAAKPAHLTEARRIFESVGLCIELEERHFNAITGLSGSGPAYMYLIMEALADGGVRVGLPRDVAVQVVAQTVLGSAHMVLETGRHPASLRDDVTTPAGCTIGALLLMEDGKIRSVLARAVEEATRIASGLGSS